MFLKKRFSIFLIFVLLVFVILTYQSIKGRPDISKFDFFYYPIEILERGISSFTNRIKNFFKTYVLIIGKEDENRRLIKKIKVIEQDKNQYLEARYENARLRELLELKSRRRDYVTAAEVFARDPTNWFQILLINKGMSGGISKNMVAVTPLGVVGRIYRVLKDSASIILITDVNSSVAARIQSSRVEGILEGSGDDRCYLEYVPQDVDVMIGDKVITSGLDDIFPEGIPIGYVSDVRKRAGGFFQVIEVVPSQDFKAVEEVAILKR